MAVIARGGNVLYDFKSDPRDSGSDTSGAVIATRARGRARGRGGAVAPRASVRASVRPCAVSVL